jgi:hypothetical protein
MGTLSTIVYCIGMLLAVVCWFIGMRAYGGVANAANIPFIRRWYSFDVYRYALGAGSTMPEAKQIWFGFGGMFVFLLAGGVLAGMLATPH